METRRRTMVKALTWRVTAVLITGTIAWILTGDKTIAVEIGAIDSLIKVFVYYIHERTWLRLPFGRAQPPEYQI